MSKILVLGAHPDDETIGVGGTILKHIENGDEVYIVCFTDGVTARHDEIETQKRIFKEACHALGATESFFMGFKDQHLDAEPLISLLKPTHEIVKNIKPDVLYTHTHGDVNQDHRRIFEVAMVLARSMPGNSIKSLIAYEVPSSTEWYPIQQNGYFPNRFVDIGKFVEKKMEILEYYSKTFQSEIKSYPHPRSIDALRKIMNERGLRVGVEYAESFMILRELL